MYIRPLLIVLMLNSVFSIPILLGILETEIREIFCRQSWTNASRERHFHYTTQVRFPL